ncbi:MAG: glycosyltransferase [Candidatus Cloacimonadota bacterium]|nr:glycosyltransferase [Candidatus Cloacimonadota bacterium]
MLLIIFFSLIITIFGLAILRTWRVPNPQEQTFSIIIACRNEEQNLPALFSFLEKIYYPKMKFEIILIDDASNDNTLNLIKKFCNEETNRLYYHLDKKDKEYKGKKAALKIGTDNAQFDYFLFTDADCMPPKNWLNGLDNFLAKDVGMVVGYSPEKNVSDFRHFSQLMSASVYSASIGAGLPYSSNGRNLAVSRKAFHLVGGYETIKDHPCGEDKLLLNLIKKTKYKIAYNPTEKVFTKPERKNNYADQQKRRYGQFDISSVFYKILLSLIFLFYIYLPYQVIVTSDLRNLGIYLFSTIIFLLATLYRHKEKFKIPYLFFILIYPYYVIYYSILGKFGTWKWKR